MKATPIKFLILASFLFCQCGNKNDYVITSKRAGDIKIDETIDQTLEKLQSYEIVELGELDDIFRYYNILDNENLIFTLAFRENKLRGIQLHHNQDYTVARNYHTKKGVGLGSSSRGLYSKGHRITSKASNGNILIVQIEEKNVFFYFQTPSPMPNLSEDDWLESIIIGYQFDINRLTEGINEPE